MGNHDRPVGPARGTTTKLGKSLPILKIVGLDKCPHKEYVQKIMESKLNPLRDVLKIDFFGKAKRAKYVFSFEHKHEWLETEKIGYRRRSYSMGITQTVNTQVLREINVCEDTDDLKTCELCFPDIPDMLGKVIANSALHEIGHMLGLLDENSYPGADSDGHTGDSSNCMFTILRHKNFRKPGEKNERTKRYLIKGDETPEKIARKKGFMSVTHLIKLRGKDGLSNEEILGRGGKDIWINDIKEQLKFQREVETADEFFTDEQIKFMKNWIKEGKTMWSVKNR